jgi:hypothetical protein
VAVHCSSPVTATTITAAAAAATGVTSIAAAVAYSHTNQKKQTDCRYQHKYKSTGSGTKTKLLWTACTTTTTYCDFEVQRTEHFLGHNGMPLDVDSCICYCELIVAFASRSCYCTIMRYRSGNYFLPLEHLPVLLLQIEPRMLLAQCALV